MSLYDLIYSQQSEPQSPEKASSPSPQRKRRKQERAAATIDASQETTSSDTTALDSFYGIPSPPKIVPTHSSSAPDVIVSNGIERRRKRKRGRQSTRPQRLPEEPVFETIEEAQRRMERTSRKKRYKQIQTRWKQRSHTVQDEEDYGNAVQHMARRVMKQNNQTPQENQDQNPAAVAKLQEDIEMNSSDEEQQEALGSLWTAMTQEEESDQSDNEENNKVDPNDYRTWDYYQLGYDAPRHDDLKDFYYTHHARLGNTFQMNIKARQERMQTMESEVTWTPVQKGSIRNLPNEQHYLKMDSPTTCYARLPFHHSTCLRAMAARVLVGSAGKNVELENRLLRDLYSAPSRTIGREYHVLTQVMEHGYDFVVFQSHKWKQRAVAARALGMMVEFHHTGPQYRIGYSLERQAIVGAGCWEFRKRVVRLLNDGKLPYEIEATLPVNEGVVEMIDDDVDVHDSTSVATSNQANRTPGSSPMDIDTPQRDSREEMDELDPSQASHHVEKDETKSANVLEDSADPSDPDSSFFHTFLGYQIDYIHKPGTQPPVPAFPLDETGVVLGGEDRFCRVYHNAKIDDSTYSMTLSALLARLGRARLDNDERAIERVQDQMMTFVDETAQQNVIQLEKFHSMRRKRNEQPSALYYRAMMGLCSFIANGGGLNELSNPSDTLSVKYGSDDDELLSASNDGNTDMKVVAQTIHNYCADCPDSTSLTIFPRIHVTTALALIAKNLPSSAAEILSRPFDDLSHRTPFDIMRKTLEHLEKKNLLVDSHTTTIGGETVSVGYLEHVVHQATEIFRQASEIDTADMLCQAWYVSGLAASLLLCSGNAIDSKVHVLPSSKEEEDDYDMLFSASDSLTKSNHEVRQKMSKFNDVRGRVATAVKKLIQMAHEQNTLLGNLMASAALEWKQLIALLVGPRTAVEDESAVWSEVRRLHLRFAVQWAITENSAETQHMVESMTRDQETSTDSMLEFLAKDVENSPSDVVAWRRLAKALGPAGTIVSSRLRKECKRSNCQDCRRLQKGLNVDHALFAYENENENRWRKDRTSWWDEHVLAQEEAQAPRVTAKEIFHVSKSVELQLSKETITMFSFDTNQHKHPEADGIDGIFMRCLYDLSVTRDSSINEIHVDNEQDERIEALVPKTFEERMRTERQAVDPCGSLVLGANDGDDRLELLCCKIMVTCHLYGISHAFISNGIWYLAQESQGVTSTFAWQCLVWLSSNGLNVSQILHDLYVQATKPERGQVSHHPPEMKEAVRLGIEIFGNEFKQIRDYFDVLKDCSLKGVQVSFDDMVVQWKKERYLTFLLLSCLDYIHFDEEVW